jgi:CBS-domain-containing membrane protein
MIQLSSDEKTAQGSMHNTILGNEETQDIQQSKTVFEIRPSAIHGRSICGIASSFYCCKSDTKIHDVADWFVKNPSFKAVGVIDDIHQSIGIITRSELFNTLSTQFGRELYFGKVVSAIARKTKNFNYNENIFSVAAEISQYIMDPEPTYFLITAAEGSFAGIFSTHDVLLYLSDITN